MQLKKIVLSSVTALVACGVAVSIAYEKRGDSPAELENASLRLNLVAKELIERQAKLISSRPALNGLPGLPPPGFFNRNSNQNLSEDYSNKISDDAHKKDLPTSETIVRPEDLVPVSERLEGALTSLEFFNRNRVLARMLVSFPIEQFGDSARQIRAFNRYAWDNRNEIAEEPFKIQTRAERTELALKFGSAALVLSFAICFAFLSLVTWTWYFFLERLAELSAAIRK
ncbi:MAG: hypothetical protein U0136_07435 [Bdellovibrionota bacterium]